ncbi:MAG: hypothetical protein IJD16_08170 [Desulfovibrio sp.]|nr:hypothetical protein [Desulfovibrio sp.]
MPVRTAPCRVSSLVPLSLLCAAMLLIAGCQLPFGKGGSAVKPVPPPSQEQCLVLALPASGPYAPITAKISRGARQAQQELTAQNSKIRLENIDTQAADWLNRLNALPAQCAVVGGPLQTRNYSLARSSGVLAQRAFFTFLPALEQGDEGARAWRFFPSRQDQIDALLDFADDGLGIRAYGALYPTDSYGVHMTSLLERTLSERRMPLYKAAYDPAAMDAWTDSAARLINPTQQEGSRTPIPQTPFQALFLPDSWKNMNMLVTSLHYNGEDRLVLLGTTLWEQSLSGRLVSHADKYALAVFPGAWSPARAPKALQGSGHDFWTALGYDFVRFGAALALNERPTSGEITARAGRAAQAMQALAPMRWDSAGQARQKLFIFQVTPRGKGELDMERFRQVRQSAIERTALRMQGLPPVDEQGKALVRPASLPGGISAGSSPQPSYKLRLPTQR